VEEEQVLAAVQVLVLAVEAVEEEQVLVLAVEAVVLAAVDLAANKKDVTNVTPSSYMN
jgi:hypothetical protein